MCEDNENVREKVKIINNITKKYNNRKNEVINIKNKHHTYEQIEKMIEEEFRNHPIVEEVSKIEISDPSVRGKYSTRLCIDEKLDDINSIREKIRHYVNEEVFKAVVEINKKYCGKINRKESKLDKNKITELCEKAQSEIDWKYDLYTGYQDMMSWGFPCQHISIAGKKDGFVDENGNITSSGLYYDGIRNLREKKPKISIIENVKNLTSKTFKNEFNQVLSDLDEAGYNVYWKVLSAANYGIPQTRERVFIIGIRKDIDNGLFKFPEPIKLTKTVQDIMETGDLSYAYLTDKQKQFILDMNDVQNNTKWSGRTNDGLLNPTIAKTLQTKGKARQRAHMNTFFVDGLPTNITVKEYKEKYKTTNPNIRYATSLERFRLMGFDDEDYYKLLSAGMSENQMNIFTGNSIVVDVLYYIFLELYKALPEVFNDLRLSSFFSGIGAFEKALDRLYKYINVSSIKHIA